MKTDIHITVVIKENKSNDLQRPQAVQVEKQVDLDQGSKLTLHRACFPLVVGFIFKLIDFIIDKMN